jgi:hypothetical protein
MDSTSPQSGAPHSDHAAHTAPPEPHPIKKNLWQRWMAWSGSFLILSILAHVILLGGATILVVQVVQSHKEKMKFNAPPPSSAGMSEHKVKHSKKTAAAAPAVSKRITSTAVNTSIAIPVMEMNTSTGPDVMASVMSGLGGAGLGSGSGGAGGAGAGGLASMPLAGLTAFGFKGSGIGGGLKGHFYDLKQLADGGHSEAWEGAKGVIWGNPVMYKMVCDFVYKDWDETFLKQFFCSPEVLTAFQIYMPLSGSAGAAKAFNVENRTKDPHWVIHYKGTVTAPKDGYYRFVYSADDFMVIRFNKQMVTAGPPKMDDHYPGWNKRMREQHLLTAQENSEESKIKTGVGAGYWFQVHAGESYPIEILIGGTGGAYNQCLMIQEYHPEKPYPQSELIPAYTALPLFQTKKGFPLPEKPKGRTNDPSMYDRYPDFAPTPIVFPAK